MFVESPFISRPGGFESFNKLFFPEPVYISQFTIWTPRWGPGLWPGQYTIRFATTATRDEIPTESTLFFDRVTTDPYELGGVVCCDFAGPINFASSRDPYLYDPTTGYLRMSIEFIPTGPHPTCSAEQLAVHDDDCYVWESFGSITDDEGYRARYGAWFDVTPVAQVTPEPMTLLLLGSGLAGVGAAARKRRLSHDA